MSGVQVPVLACFQTIHFPKEIKLPLKLSDFQVVATAGIEAMAGLMLVDDVWTVAHGIGDRKQIESIGYEP